MKAPCKTNCRIDIYCRYADSCEKWKRYVLKIRNEREEPKMKCPKCHANMERKEMKPGVYFYECEKCHYEVGKPKEADNNG